MDWIQPLIQAFSAFLATCAALFDVNWRWWAGAATTTIVVTIVQAFRDPGGAVNQFLITIIDIVLVPWPSTPPNLKLSYLARQFALSIPQELGNGVIYELLIGVFGMLSIYLIYKVYKSAVPFV